MDILLDAKGIMVSDGGQEGKKEDCREEDKKMGRAIKEEGKKTEKKGPSFGRGNWYGQWKFPKGCGISDLFRGLDDRQEQLVQAFITSDDTFVRDWVYFHRLKLGNNPKSEKLSVVPTCYFCKDKLKQLYKGLGAPTNIIQHIVEDCREFEKDLLHHRTSSQESTPIRGVIPQVFDRLSKLVKVKALPKEWLAPKEKREKKQLEFVEEKAKEEIQFAFENNLCHTEAGAPALST